MERRLKLKSMKRVASHRLKEHPLCVELSPEKRSLENPPALSVANIQDGSFMCSEYAPTAAADSTVTVVANGNAETFSSNELFFIRAVNGVEIYSSDRTRDATKKFHDDRGCGDCEELLPVSGKNDTEKIISNNKTTGLDTLIKNAVNTMESDKYKLKKKLSSDSINELCNEAISVKNTKENQLVKTEKSNYGMNEKKDPNKCINNGFASDSDDCSADDSDSYDSEGVTHHLQNYQRNIVLSNINNKIKILNEYSAEPTANISKKLSTDVPEEKSTIYVSSPATSPLPGPKIPLVKSRSLNIHRSNNATRVMNIGYDDKSASSNAEVVETIERPTIGGCSRRSSVIDQPRIADDFVDEVSKCLGTNMLSAFLDRIDENGTNSVVDCDRNSPEIPHFTVHFDKQYRSQLNALNPEMEQVATNHNPVHKIRHSKSDVHLSSPSDNRLLKLNNGTKTMNCREKSPQSRDTPIRRTKSRHEGQILGFKIDGFNVRKLSQLKEQGEKHPHSHETCDKDVVNLSGTESCGGSDAGDHIDGAKRSTVRKNSRLETSLLAIGNSCLDVSSHLSAIPNVSEDSRSDCTSVYSDSCTTANKTLCTNSSSRATGRGNGTPSIPVGDGIVGGALRRCVQLLRSRSAVSQRDRPVISSPPLSNCKIIGPGQS